ncbi:25595_t:CDS:1 [Racocetra persica]|uniref:25595_t:CDS:1 n=1 Tax=Racocetra persica TaxID=160502 RepID=A0ACA9MID2_9GLOM|nr:25595_t:CDS:1 [Racocetra persica]
MEFKLKKYIAKLEITVKNLINILNDSKEYTLKQEYFSEAIQINIKNKYNNTLKVIKSKYTNKIKQETLRQLKRKYPNEVIRRKKIKTRQPKIIVLTGAIGVEKSTFEEKFMIYLEEKRYKIYRPVEASLLLDDELKLFCKDSKNNALFFQYVILNFYKKQAVEINMIDLYDFVILDRTHIDTEVFILMNTEDEEVIDFLGKKRQEIKIENINKVLYLKPTDKNMIKR